MDSQNLQTASAYINNLLLARGLLRNGKVIEFAKPSKAEEGKNATMARIINLVHDLVLRRDREAEHRESVASTLRTLRGTETRQTLGITRLEAKNVELYRQLALAAGQERTFKITLRTAENNARSMREEMLRLRTMVQQVRSQCANDIRKRDLEMRRLKEHLHGHQRGKREGLGLSTIVIKPTPTNMNSSLKAGEVEGGEDLDSPNYSLRQETTEFLTQLSQGLSDENDNLIGLVRSTLTILRNLQGLSLHSSATSRAQHQDGIEQAESRTDDAPAENALLALPVSYETLSADMDNVLEHLRALLTNPSFVPIEEVEVREEEIGRLREGWEKMEGRWREALAMMDGWKKRMVNDGDTISLEDLKMGLGLGSGLNGAPETKDASLSVNEEDDDDEADSSVEDDPQNEASSDGEEAVSVTDETNTSREHLKRSYETMSGEDEPEEPVLGQEAPILTGTTGNARPTISSPRKVSFTGIPEESPTSDHDRAGDSDIDELAFVRSSISKSKSKPTSTSPTKHSLDSSRSKSSKIPRQTVKSTQSCQATIQQKLDGARLEAEAAAAADAEQDRKGSGAPGRRRKSLAKTRIGGRVKRRRSTLSAEELVMLMGIE